MNYEQYAPKMEEVFFSEILTNNCGVTSDKTAI
jgi:hypothetical protein